MTSSGRNWTYEHQTYRSQYLSNDTSDGKVTNIKVVENDEGYLSVSSKIKCGDIKGVKSGPKYLNIKPHSVRFRG